MPKLVRGLFVKLHRAAVVYRGAQAIGQAVRRVEERVSVGPVGRRLLEVAKRFR